MTEGAAPPVLRATTATMRRLLLVAAVLVALAGAQLFVFPDRTDRYFSWTIGVPLTAAFLGAGYWASVPLEWLSGRARLWADCRPSVAGVFVFTCLTLVATLLHLDLFHLGPEFSAGTRAVTWAWMAIYVVVPLAFVVALAGQLRRPGTDPPRAAPLPSPFRAALAGQAAVMGGLGVAIFVFPDRVAGWWPWPLTPLTGRAVGAWLVALGVVAAQAVFENDLGRLRSVMISDVVLAVLQLVALARFPDAVDWTPAGWVYAIFVLGLLATGLYGWARAPAPGRQAL